MKELIESVKVLASEELKRANVEFPAFNSTHEGYAVIKEEIEESSDELEDVNFDLNNMWRYIKLNNTNEATKYAKHLKQSAINLAAEAIQVAAMAQKFIDSSKQWEAHNE